MRILEEPEQPFVINIVPMIDVVFSILAFFIMSSLFLTKSQGLPVNLPQAATSEQQTQVDFNVTVDNSGTIFLNRAPIALESLQEEVTQALQSKLASHPASQSAGLATINADEAVPHGVVVEVMDQLRSIEGLRLGIATKAVGARNSVDGIKIDEAEVE